MSILISYPCRLRKVHNSRTQTFKISRGKIFEGLAQIRENFTLKNDPLLLLLLIFPTHQQVVHFQKRKKNTNTAVLN